MMEDLKRERELREENKVLNRIHEQNREARMNEQMDRQLKEITQVEKLKKRNLIATILLILALLALIFLGIKYNEKEIAGCIESGKSETFCRYAGE